MKRRLVAGFFLVVYSVILIKLMVFKNVFLKLGHFRLRLGPEGTGQANFVPFKTILAYLQGSHGWAIAGTNLVGNIALLAPIGFLVPFIYSKITWQESLALAIATPLVIEGMQVIFRLGIFDIDDVILNALGVMIGYWVFILLSKGVLKKN